MPATEIPPDYRLIELTIRLLEASKGRACEEDIDEVVAGICHPRWLGTVDDADD